MTGRVLAAVIILAALLFGAVEVWSSTLITFLIYSLGLAWLLKGGSGALRFDAHEKMLFRALGLFALFVLLQAVPLPSAVVRIAAPGSYAIWDSYSFGPKQFMTISIDPYKTLTGMHTLAASAIVFIVAMRELRERDRMLQTLGLLMLCGFVLSLFGIVQKGLWNGKIYWFRELTAGGSPFGPFVNRNHFAGFVGMLIPLCLGLALTVRRREEKLLYGFMGVIMSVALFFSLSRGGILSFIGSISLFGLLMVVSRVQQKRIWMAGLFLVVLLCYLLYLGADQLIQRFYETDITREDRLVVWASALRAFKAFWTAGAGLGTIVTIFPAYLPAGIINAYDHAHNDYLEFMVETGVAGMLLAIFFMAALLHRITLTNLRARGGIMRMAAAGSMTFMAIHSIFDFNLHIFSNQLLFSLILGLVAALSEPSREEPLKTAPSEKTLLPHRKKGEHKHRKHT